jgi:hypothetical protein
VDVDDRLRGSCRSEHDCIPVGDLPN